MLSPNKPLAIVMGILVIVAASLALAGPNGRKLSGSVKIDGSSTVYPITEAVAESFQEEAPRVRVPVGISGTGGGFKRFTVGETDISDASRPIKKKELDVCRSNGVEFIEIPVAYDGLSIVVNKKNTWVDHLSVDELKKIFLDGAHAMTWKDVRPEWPERRIKIYAPGTDSGTFDYFKEVVAGKKGSIRGDMQVSEDDNVLVRGVAGDEASIGFFGCAYYYENTDTLRAVPIDGGKGPVAPEPGYIEDGSYAPFSRPLFIYVNKASARKPQVKAFVEYYLSVAGDMAEEVGYVRLPKSVYEIGQQKWKTKETGTHFLDKAGEKLKGSVVELYH